jgi:pectate lyase
MKFTGVASSIAVLASVVAGSPTPTIDERAALDARTIAKRATISDACDIGYASQNGG